MEVDNKLIPVLMEGVGVVKMALFKRLKEHFGEIHPDWEPAHAGRLAGAVINDLFCTPNMEPQHLAFTRENRLLIVQHVRSLSANQNFADLMPHLTDALRVAFLCDHNQGLDTAFVLTRAKQLGILDENKPIPLPRHFMESVRKLGDAMGLVVPAAIPEEEAPEAPGKKQ